MNSEEATGPGNRIAESGCATAVAAEGGGWAAPLVVCAIVLLGLGLRLYRLDAQSIWLDEYPNVANLNAPDALTYVRLIQVLFPEQAQAPLYYFMQYYWAHAAGSSVYVLRLLPVILGLLGVPLLYMLGRYLYGPCVGVIAALCLALSPQHIWHAQEIRPYALVTTLVIVAVYALLRALREGGARWWALNLLVNVLLVWTHVFAVLFLAVQGCFFLIFARRRFRQGAIWAAVLAVLLIPWSLWMLRMPYTNEHPALFVSVSEILGDIFADDVVQIHKDLLPSWKTNPPEALSPYLNTMLRVRPELDYALVGVFVLATCVLALRCLPKRRGGQAESPETPVFFLLLLVLPGLTLGILTLATGRPFLSPMYTMFNTVSMYLAIGLLVTSLARVWQRALAVGVLGVLYAYQLAITLPDVTRTDWASGADYIRAHGSARDLVLDFEFFWPVNCLEYYLRDRQLPVLRVSSVQAACDDSAAFLERAGAASGSERPSAWLAFESQFIYWLFPEYAMGPALERDFAARGLRFTRTLFPGHRNLLLLRIERNPETNVGNIGAPVTPFRPIDYALILDEIGAHLTDGPARDSALAALRRVIPYWPPLNKCFAAVDCFDLIREGQPQVAEAMARMLIERHPNFGLAYLALGMALAAERQTEDAVSAFSKSFALHDGLENLVGPFAAAVCGLGDPESAAREIERLDRMGFFFTDALRAVSRARFGEERVSGR